MHRRVLLGLKTALAVALLVLVFRLVPLEDVGTMLALANIPVFAAGVLLYVANKALATLQLRIITASQGLNIGRGALFRMLLAVQFYALFLPGVVAGGAATFMKYVEHGADKGAAATIIIVNRGLGLMVMLSVVAIAIALDPRFNLISVPLGLALIGAALGLILLFGNFWPRGTPLSGRVRNRFLHGLLDFIERFLSVQRLPVRDKITVLAGAVAYELVDVTAMWICARAIDVPVDFMSVLWIRGLLQLVLLLPLSVAGFGVREASLVGFGSLVGIPPADAVAWSFILFGAGLGVGLLGGLLEASGWSRPPVPAGRMRVSRRRVAQQSAAQEPLEEHFSVPASLHPVRRTLHAYRPRGPTP